MLCLARRYNYPAKQLSREGPANAPLAHRLRNRNGGEVCCGTSRFHAPNLHPGSLHRIAEDDSGEAAPLRGVVGAQPSLASSVAGGRPCSWHKEKEASSQSGVSESDALSVCVQSTCVR